MFIVHPFSPALFSASRGAGSRPRRAAITFRTPWTAKEQKGADEAYSLDVEIPGLQPHGESCDGRRLPKISGIREEYILEWKFQKIIFQTFASAMQHHTNIPYFSVWIEVADP